MMNDDLLADLPAPSDDEPPSLRSDIADELADHLHCALRRELVKDGNAPAAEARVLHRFGDPQSIARRLWWQAMWSHIMRQRMVTGLQWLMTSAAVILAGAVFWQQLTLLDEIRSSRKAESENYQVLSEAIQEIRANRSTSQGEKAKIEEAIVHDVAPIKETTQPKPTTASSSVGVEENEQKPAAAQSLTVKLVQGSAEGPAIAGATVRIAVEDGRNFGRRGAGIARNGGIPRTDGSGLYRKELSHPDRCDLTIGLPDGQTSLQSVLVRANEHREVTVICPAPREKSVIQISAPALPKSLQERGRYISLSLQSTSEMIGQVEWTPPDASIMGMEFASQGGAPTKIFEPNSNRPMNLIGPKPEDRAVVMHSGPVKCRGLIMTKTDSGEAVLCDEFDMTSVIQPGEERWRFELPEEFLSKVEKQWVKRVAPAIVAEPAVAAPALEEPSRDTCRLIVKINTLTKDGLVPTDAVVKVTASQDGGEAESYHPFDPEGYCKIDDLESGRYKLEVTANKFRSESQNVLLRPGQKRVEQVICPPIAKKITVVVTAPAVPDDLRKSHTYLTGKIAFQPIALEGRTWVLTEGSPLLTFDPTTGELTVVGNSNVSRDAPEDRVLFASSGSYVMEPVVNFSPFDRFSWPIEKFEKDSLVFEAKAGENKWELKLPEQFWTEAREKSVVKPGAPLRLY